MKENVKGKIVIMPFLLQGKELRDMNSSNTYTAKLDFDPK